MRQKEEKMKLYAAKAQELMTSFEDTSISLVPHDENMFADALNNRVALAPPPFDIHFIEHPDT